MTPIFKKQMMLAAAIGLTATMVQAQTPTIAREKTPAAPEVQTSVTPGDGVSAVNTEPRYAAGDLARAFGFMDGNKDGKVSREEAGGFRNVAKHFDAADTNRDQALSLEEFSSAMNRPKNP